MRELKPILIDKYILAALQEDMTSGDITTDAILKDERAEVNLRAKDKGILAGLDVFKRVFEKYAVTLGGGYNHRYNLSDGIMLKDNHIDAAGGIREAVEKVRRLNPFVKKIEVEVENFDQVREALEAKADIIMLDNMDIEEIKEACKIINKRAIIECSGNISLENINSYRDLDIDYISSGAITYSAGVLDLSMKNLKIY